MSAARELTNVADRLCAISREAFLNPHTAVEWPASIPEDAWLMSPELVSIHGTPAWDALDEAQRKRLAFWETVNFFSLNINGEKALIEGLSKRLYPRERPELTAYIHHFLDEENKHMQWFGTFCLRYAGKTYPDKKLALGDARPTREDDFLFFLKVMIFEEIVDVYNARMAKDDRLLPVAQRINFLHHQDETRHLAFGRLLVKELWEELVRELDAEYVARLRTYAAEYLRSTWREYYNPDVYKDAGIPDSYRVYTQALQHEATRAHRRAVSQKCVRWLTEVGVLTEEPTP